MSVLQVVYAPACFWEDGARCFVGRFSFGRRMVAEAGAFFGKYMTWNIIFREGCKRFVTPYVLQLIAVPVRSQAGLRKPHKSDGTRLWKLRG